MARWCIHLRRLADGEQRTIKLNGPDDGRRIYDFADRTLRDHAPGQYEVEMVHQEPEPGSLLLVIPYFPTAIENMVFQGLLVVQALTGIAHFIINKQKEN